MNIVNTSSLAATLNNLNSAFLENRKLSTSEKKEIASYIASRQGLPRSYWNMFAPTDEDYKGISLFTGEKVKTGAGISHILGEESLRALYLLNAKGKKIDEAVLGAEDGLQKAMERSKLHGYYAKGTYCCATCTAAYWRNLSAEGSQNNKDILKAGMKYLKSMRDGKGRWKRFPFYYTLLALSGIDLPESKSELEYTSGVLMRLAVKENGKSLMGKRRKSLINNILSSI
jgi:hypothetical protein